MYCRPGTACGGWANASAANNSTNASIAQVLPASSRATFHTEHGESVRLIMPLASQTTSTLHRLVEMRSTQRMQTGCVARRVDVCPTYHALAIRYNGICHTMSTTPFCIARSSSSRLFSDTSNCLIFTHSWCATKIVKRHALSQLASRIGNPVLLP